MFFAATALVAVLRVCHTNQAESRSVTHYSLAPLPTLSVKSLESEEQATS